MLSSLLQWSSAKTAQVGHSSRHPATVSTSRHSWEELCRGACGDPPHSQSNHHLSKWRESLRLHSTMYSSFHSDSTFLLSISWILCVTAFVQWVGGFFKSQDLFSGEMVQSNCRTKPLNCPFWFGTPSREIRCYSVPQKRGHLYSTYREYTTFAREEAVLFAWSFSHSCTSGCSLHVECVAV